MKKNILFLIITIGIGIISVSAQNNSGTNKTETNHRVKQRPVRRTATLRANSIDAIKTENNTKQPTNTPPRNGGSFGRKEIEAKTAPTPELTPTPK